MTSLQLGIQRHELLTVLGRGYPAAFWLSLLGLFPMIGMSLPRTLSGYYHLSDASMRKLAFPFILCFNEVVASSSPSFIAFGGSPAVFLGSSMELEQFDLSG